MAVTSSSASWSFLSWTCHLSARRYVLMRLIWLATGCPNVTGTQQVPSVGSPPRGRDPLKKSRTCAHRRRVVEFQPGVRSVDAVPILDLAGITRTTLGTVPGQQVKPSTHSCWRCSTQAGVFGGEMTNLRTRMAPAFQWRPTGGLLTRPMAQVEVSIQDVGL